MPLSLAGGHAGPPNRAFKESRQTILFARSTQASIPFKVAPASTRRCPACRVTLSYLTRVLRLTLLAPDLVAAILDGRQGPEVTLAKLMEPFPAEWAEQFQSLVAA